MQYLECNSCCTYGHFRRQRFRLPERQQQPRNPSRVPRSCKYFLRLFPVCAVDPTAHMQQAGHLLCAVWGLPGRVHGWLPGSRLPHRLRIRCLPPGCLSRRLSLCDLMQLDVHMPELLVSVPILWQLLDRLPGHLFLSEFRDAVWGWPVHVILPRHIVQPQKFQLQLQLQLHAWLSRALEREPLDQ
jgi:hypothetical protein